MLRSSDFIHLDRLIGVLKVARNQFKEIFYMEFMSLAFHTSLDILMLVLRQGVEFFFSMLKEGGENHLI